LIRWALIALVSAACARKGTPPPPVLLFDGRGTSSEDVAAIESLLDENGIAHATAGSWRLDRMSADELGAYKLLIVPGGNYETIGKHLGPATPDRVRSAVQNGMSYLGICAGAFMAGNLPLNGFNLTGGVRFPFYSDENRGIRKAALAIARPGEPALEQYWEDGPSLTGWGDVAAKYPDGTPAVVEGAVGRGFVLLVGVHPEAPASWRSGMQFATPLAADRAYAASLIAAALHHTALAHY
jgi:hypothetical protein